MKMDFIKPSGMDKFSIETQNENWNKAQTGFLQMAPGILAESAKGAIVTVKDASDNPLYATVHGKTEQALKKYLTSLTESSLGLQTNIISVSEGDVIVATCSRKVRVDIDWFLEDGLVEVETGTVSLDTHTISAGSAKAISLLFRGATSDDTITITVNGSEYILPEPIHGVGESGVLEVKSTGKNIFGGLPFAQSLVDSGSTNVVLNTNAKTVTYGYNTNYEDTVRRTLFSNFKENTQYTFVLSGKHVVGNTNTGTNHSQFVVYYTDGTSKSITISGTDNFTELFVSEANKTVSSIHYSYFNRDTLTLNYEKCGIFEGVITADEFEPYTETTADIPLSSPLYEKDYIRYNMDGSGEESHKMKAVVYDGSESGWFKNSSTGSYYIDIPNAKMGGAVWCSHYIYNSDNFAEGNIVIGSTSTKLFIMPTAAQNITTVDEWKAWLAENKPEVVYELAEPIVTELTAEQIAEFKKLQSFYPVTNATTNEGEISIEYIADTKRYIDNKIEELQNAILTSV